MILAEVAIFLPLAMVRNLAKLSGTALVADAFILIGSKLAPLQSMGPQLTSSRLHRLERILDYCPEWRGRCGHVQPGFIPSFGRYRCVRLRGCRTVSGISWT